MEWTLIFGLRGWDKNAGAGINFRHLQMIHIPFVYRCSVPVGPCAQPARKTRLNLVIRDAFKSLEGGTVTFLFIFHYLIWNVILYSDNP